MHRCGGTSTRAYMRTQARGATPELECGWVERSLYSCVRLLYRSAAAAAATIYDIGAHGLSLSLCVLVLALSVDVVFAPPPYPTPRDAIHF